MATAKILEHWASCFMLSRANDQQAESRSFCRLLIRHIYIKRRTCRNMSKQQWFLDHTAFSAF